MSITGSSEVAGKPCWMTSYMASWGVSPGAW